MSTVSQGDNAPLVVSPDSEMMADSLRALLSGTPTLRQVRDRALPAGFDGDCWSEFKAAGFAAVAVPEHEGGAGLGLSGAIVVAEGLGRAMTGLPFIEGGVGASMAATLFPARVQAALTDDTARVAFALEETGQHVPLAPRCRIAQSGDQPCILDGRKTFVLFAEGASHYLVTARDNEDRLALVLVDARLAGISAEHYRLLDGTVAADLEFSGVRVDPDMLVVDSAESLQKLLDAARVVAAGELLGLAQAVFERTLDYLKTRRQFGKAIGSFQALQHRAAHMHAELELTRSLLMSAARAFDNGSRQSTLLASGSKAQAGAAASLVIQEGIQMHGGIGMTDELDIGLFLKRARILDRYLGDARFHKRRIAGLNGY